MAQRKSKRKDGRTHLRAMPTNALISVGQFAMTPSADGKARRIRIEYPANLTTQERYDVATALAKAAAKLVGEADAANEALAAEVAPSSPLLRVVPAVTLAEIRDEYEAALVDPASPSGGVAK